MDRKDTPREREVVDALRQVRAQKGHAEAVIAAHRAGIAPRKAGIASAHAPRAKGRRPTGAKKEYS